jgi:ribosomal protein L22
MDMMSAPRLPLDSIFKDLKLARDVEERTSMATRHQRELQIQKEFMEEEKEQELALRRESQRRVNGKTYEELPLHQRNFANMETVLNPEPERRRIWLREKVIEEVRKGGKLTREEHLRRAERQCRSQSPQLKSSVKKLGFLARQIAGKTVEDAMVQMRFSKKRTAPEILKHLEHARDEAVVKWGMNLGKAEDRTGEPIKIQLKTGKWKEITDRTGLYIDQAWVEKGKKDTTLEYRARGTTNRLIHRYASKFDHAPHQSRP